MRSFVVVEIQLVSSFRFEDENDALSFAYKDDHQKFYFFAQFANPVPGEVKDGVHRLPTYDVLITHLGKTDVGGTVTCVVADMDVVKKNIAEYFKTHPLDLAKQPPVHVIFG